MGVTISARVTAITLIAATVGGMVFLGVGQDSTSVGARAGLLDLSPCTYATENGAVPADCGTLSVPENRHDPRSRLISVPVVRVRAKSSQPAEPIFRFNGGPGQSNMVFPQASRLIAGHDLVMVGYRGVDGSSRLDCPEVTTVVAHSRDLLAPDSLTAQANAFRACANRLTSAGVDLAGYSLPEQIDDMEAARTALGYHRIDLLSTSEGTRLAMVYSWRYPASINRSVMFGVNPPGHFLWDPSTTDSQLAYVAQLCARDSACRARTGDLTATMRSTAANMPNRWAFLRIKPGDARLASFFGLFDSRSAPPDLPGIVDAWLAAAHGDPSGLWFASAFGGLVFPTSFVWGEAAAIGMADAPYANAYFAAHPREEHDTVIGNPGTAWFWADGALTKAWPAAPDATEYSQVRTSRTDTLLIGGTLDFTAPAQNATRELLPYLPNGHQVVLSGIGHTPDFWSYEPDAGKRLILTYFDSGRVDQSGYTPAAVDFTPGPSYPALAKIVLAVLLGLALLTPASLIVLALRARRRGRFGPVAGATLRSAYAAVLGLGGWCLAVLVVLTALPTVAINDHPVVAIGVGIPIGLVVHLAWSRRDRTSTTATIGLVTALACALIGGWLGFQVLSGITALGTAIVGGIVGANLPLLVLDTVQDRPRRGAGPLLATESGGSGELSDV